MSEIDAKPSDAVRSAREDDFEKGVTLGLIEWLQLRATPSLRGWARGLMLFGALKALAMIAPPAALRYVLVHEMCHLKVRSHAPRFWTRVGELMPGYQAQRDWLREHGAILKAEMERLIAP